MTDSELEHGKQLLREAFELRIKAAEAYLAACEYLVPRVNGDPENIREARRCLALVSRVANSTLVNLRTHGVAELTETFKHFQREY
jgi:hypothetical protein